MTDQEYELLSAIAPSIAQSGDHPDSYMPWQEQTRMVGQALGKASAAEALVAETESMVRAAREQQPVFEGVTAAVAFVFDDKPIACASADPRSRLQDLGFTSQKDYDELAGDQFVGIRIERLDLLDVDTLVWISDDDAARARIDALPGRTGLAASAEGREVFAGQMVSGALSLSSLLSIPRLIDELVPELASAVAGNGSPTSAAPRTPVAPLAVELSGEDLAAAAAHEVVFDSAAWFDTLHLDHS